jgi:valyl-tRNA synthetase
MSLGDGPVAPLAAIERDLALEDRWILSRLGAAAAAATRDLERFRLHEVADGLYHFFWGDVCDWYLELIKGRLGAGSEVTSREAARTTLVAVLDQVLRLLHPIVPFVTAELWSRLPVATGVDRAPDLIVAPWPQARDARPDAEAESRMGDFRALVVEVRRVRKEYGVAEGKRVAIRVVGGPPGFAERLGAQRAALEQLARIDRVTTEPALGVGAHAVLPNGAEVFVPLEGVIDLDRERARLREEIARADGLRAATASKLDNEKFVANAPADVVGREREKAAQFAEQAAKLRDKLAVLEA